MNRKPETIRPPSLSAHPSAVQAPRVRVFSAVVCVEGEVSTRRLPDSEKLLIGREDSCAVSLGHLSVSRNHAILHLPADGMVTVEDLGSANGTRVNGNRIEPGTHVTVTAGSVLEFGTVTFLLQYGSLNVGQRRNLPKLNQGSEEEEATASTGPSGNRLVAVGADPQMLELYRLVDQVSASAMPFLILGETGVGKELFAERIHRRSSRRREPFVKLNCAALPEMILESELFGHERGAFSGAVSTKVGLFEAANGGAIFLDEVGELSLAIQAKLLRAFETHEITRVGATKPRPIDVRFISATNRDLRALISNGQYRADLFYRLNGVSVTIPPLRERPNDLTAFVELFLSECAERFRKPMRLTPDAYEAIRRYRWPGNVRELRNVIQRAALLSVDGTIGAERLGLHVEGPAGAFVDSVPASRTPPPPESNRWSSPDPPGGHGAIFATLFPGAPLPSSSLRQRPQGNETERQRIVEALHQSGGNQGEAAALLGYSRRTLINRLDELGIARPRKKPKSTNEP